MPVSTLSIAICCWVELTRQPSFLRVTDGILQKQRAGGPVTEQHFSYRKVFEEVIARMQVLQDLGLTKGDRIAFNLPNIPEQIFYMLAAQRMGVVYTPVFGGFSAKTLSDRIHDAGAKLVITADGGYRNAEVVGYKGN